MFFKLGGTLVVLDTENERPIASPSLMYGSCPTITTFSLLNYAFVKALKIRFEGGKQICAAYSLFTNLKRFAKDPDCKCLASTSYQSPKALLKTSIESS